MDAAFIILPLLAEDALRAVTVHALLLWLTPFTLTLGVLLALPVTVRALPLWLAPFTFPLGVLLVLPVC